MGNQQAVAESLQNLAQIACTQREPEKARSFLVESLALWREVEDHQWGAAECLETVAGMALAHGQPEQAARLLAAADALLQAVGIPRHSDDHQADYERAVGAARAALGDEAFAVAWTEGSALSLEQAVTAALASLCRA